MENLRIKTALALAVLRSLPENTCVEDHLASLRARFAANQDPFADPEQVLALERALWPSEPPAAMVAAETASMRYLRAVLTLKAGLSEYGDAEAADLQTALLTVVGRVRAALSPDLGTVWLSLHHGVHLAVSLLAGRSYLIPAVRGELTALADEILQAVMSVQQRQLGGHQHQLSRLITALAGVPQLSALILQRLTRHLATTAETLQRHHRGCLLGWPASQLQLSPYILRNSYCILQMLTTIMSERQKSAGCSEWSAAVVDLRHELDRATLFISDRFPRFAHLVWDIAELIDHKF